MRGKINNYLQHLFIVNISINIVSYKIITMYEDYN